MIKKTEMVMPANCETVKEEEAKKVYGGAVVETVATLVELAWAYGYPAAGAYAKQLWPNGIPTGAKIALMAAFPDPIGWIQFMNGYNGN